MQRTMTAPSFSKSGGSDDFRSDVEAYRRLGFRLAESRSAGAFDEYLLDEIMQAEDRVMGAAPTNLAVILTKFEIATEDHPGLNQDWLATIRADIMQLGGLDSSPLGTPFV